MPSSIRRHHWSSASILHASVFDIAQQSEPYRNIGKFHVLYSFNFVEMVRRDLQIWFSKLCMAARQDRQWAKFWLLLFAYSFTYKLLLIYYYNYLLLIYYLAWVWGWCQKMSVQLSRPGPSRPRPRPQNLASRHLEAKAWLQGLHHCYCSPLGQHWIQGNWSVRVSEYWNVAFNSTPNGIIINTDINRKWKPSDTQS